MTTVTKLLVMLTYIYFTELLIGGGKFPMNDLEVALNATLTQIINSDESYQKLVKAAGEKQYKVVDNAGGGSCQFLAVSQQVEHHHGELIDGTTLRQRVVQQLRTNPFTVSWYIAYNQQSATISKLLVNATE